MVGIVNVGNAATAAARLHEAHHLQAFGEFTYKIWFWYICPFRPKCTRLFWHHRRTVKRTLIDLMNNQGLWRIAQNKHFPVQPRDPAPNKYFWKLSWSSDTYGWCLDIIRNQKLRLSSSRVKCISPSQACYFLKKSSEKTLLKKLLLLGELL